MADRTIYTRQAALREATVVKTSLALSFLRLFNATLIPDVTTTLTQLEDAETTLVGYPAGGYPITAFTGPGAATGGGAVITSPLIPVAYASGAEAAIGGGWIEDATGVVRVVAIFDPPRTLAQLGDGFDFVRQLLYGRNVI